MFKKLSPNLLRNSFDFNFTANDFFFNKNTVSYFFHQNYQISNILIKFFKYLNLNVIDIKIIRLINRCEINFFFLKRHINKKKFINLKFKKIHKRIKILKFFTLFFSLKFFNKKKRNKFKIYNFFFTKINFLDLYLLNYNIKYIGLELFFNFINKFFLFKFLLFKFNKLLLLFDFNLKFNNVNLFKKIINYINVFKKFSYEFKKKSKKI